MLLHTTPSFTIYFGDAADKLYQADYLNLPATSLLKHPSFAHLKNHMPLQDLIFLRQVHGTDGLQVSDPLPRPFAVEGDYLITRNKTAVGVMTADCLPIVFYDSKNHIAAIAHAGWRGSVAEIGRVTLQAMHRAVGAQPADVQVFFGPSIKSCCYQVAPDFTKNIQKSGLENQVIMERGGAFFFDLPKFNEMELIKAGIQPKAINLDYNLCTACNHDFFSYRRQGEAAGRQMTVVGLTF